MLSGKISIHKEIGTTYYPPQNQTNMDDIEEYWGIPYRQTTNNKNRPKALYVLHEEIERAKKEGFLVGVQVKRAQNYTNIPPQIGVITGYEEDLETAYFAHHHIQWSVINVKWNDNWTTNYNPEELVIIPPITSGC